MRMRNLVLVVAVAVVTAVTAPRALAVGFTDAVEIWNLADLTGVNGNHLTGTLDLGSETIGSGAHSDNKFHRAPGNALTNSMLQFIGESTTYIRFRWPGGTYQGTNMFYKSSGPVHNQGIIAVAYEASQSWITPPNTRVIALNRLTPGSSWVGLHNADQSFPVMNTWYDLYITETATGISGAVYDLAASEAAGMLVLVDNTTLNEAGSGAVSWGSGGVTNIGSGNFDVDIVAVWNRQLTADDRLLVTLPEPASLALLGLGGLMMLRRRRA